MVNNIITCTVDGKVFLCDLNCQGSWHDGSLCANILLIANYMCDNIMIRVYKIRVNEGSPLWGDADGILCMPISKRPARTLSPTLHPYSPSIHPFFIKFVCFIETGKQMGIHCLQG